MTVDEWADKEIAKLEAFRKAWKSDPDKHRWQCKDRPLYDADWQKEFENYMMYKIFGRKEG